MGYSSATSRQAWQDRWSEPTLDQLLDPLKAHQRRHFDEFISHLRQTPGVREEIIWYGPAWKWTIHFVLTDAVGRPLQTMGYLVPNSEMPLVCIPLSDRMIDVLPIKRLNRFIREGIRSAKCAVAIHWATWTINSLAEVALLLDLVKRKHKFLTAPPDAASEPVGDDAGEPAKSNGRASRGQAPVAAPAKSDGKAGRETGRGKEPKTKPAKGDTKAEAKADAKPGQPAKPAKASAKPVKAARPAKVASAARKPVAKASISKKAGTAKPRPKAKTKPIKAAGKSPTTAKPKAGASRKPSGPRKVGARPAKAKPRTKAAARKPTRAKTAPRKRAPAKKR